MSAFGMFNALVMSYSRLPLAMAQDGMLPKVFGRTHARTRAPWVAIVVLATGWALCLGLGFERLVTLDIILYGASLMLEFVTIGGAADSGAGVEKRISCAGRIGGRDFSWRVSIAAAGFGCSTWRERDGAGMNGLIFGMVIIVAGFVVYLATARLRGKAQRPRM